MIDCKTLNEKGINKKSLNQGLKEAKFTNCLSNIFPCDSKIGRGKMVFRLYASMLDAE